MTPISWLTGSPDGAVTVAEPAKEPNGLTRAATSSIASGIPSSFVSIAARARASAADGA
jgi:hypothetical protein